jgi:hypothetical protein
MSAWLIVLDYTDDAVRRVARDAAALLTMASWVPARLELLQRISAVEKRVWVAGGMDGEPHPEVQPGVERELTQLRLESMELPLSEEELLCLPARIQCWEAIRSKLTADSIPILDSAKVLLGKLYSRYCLTGM